MIEFIKQRSIGFALLTLAGLTLFGFYSKDVAVSGSYQYDGTYSLFIKSNGALTFNWITSNKDSGYYELLTENQELITKGRTAPSKVHQLKSELTISEPTFFRFGNLSDSIYTVRLKPPKQEYLSIHENVDSVFVVGDVHGRYDELINLLQKSNVIDDSLNWVVENAHLVFLGDLFDRGNDVTKVLWFIYQLEDKADLAGGKVHLVLGNHEIMTMSNDLRYVGAKENAIASTFGIKYNEMFHPINSLLGNWLVNKPAIIKIENAIFAHGGIIDLNTKSIADFNSQVQSYMQEPVFLDIMENSPDTTRYSRELWNQRYSFFYNQYSPFWYRGYVRSDTLNTQLVSMLRKYKSKVHIVAHTPLESITKRYGGKLLTTDLNEAATQLLFLEKKGKKYIPFRIDSNGLVTKLD